MNRCCTLLLLGCLGCFLTQCSKTEQFQSAQINEYVNPAPGKYIIYKLDSIKFINFGQKDTIIRYQAKDLIDAPITDNLGRPGWRVIRYLRDSASTNESDWRVNSTYMITPTRETLEVIENNLRYQKLKLPMKEGVAWKGNSFIDSYSINSEVRFLFDWDYVYEKVDSPFTPVDKAVANTITVNERDELLGVINNPDSYSERTFSKEVYAKGIGLIYKDFLHWIFQPRNNTYPSGYKEGYGIRMRMIQHN